jgi:predicted dehydrogenase
LTRIAIVGAGYMAAEHARAFSSLPGIDIVGFVGRSHDRVTALAAQYNAPVFSDIAELWAQTKADGIVVAVPELACRGVCEQLFKYPWISLLEKPAGRNLAEAAYLFNSATQHNHNAFVALNRRPYSSTRHALARLGDDDSQRFVLIHDTQDMNVARELGQPSEVINDWMFANSVHLVDYARLLCRGEIKEVAVGLPFDNESPCSVSATVQFSSGDQAVYFAAWNKPGPWFVTAANSTIRVELRPLEQVGIQRLGERTLSMIETDADDVDFKPGLLYQAQEFVKALQGDTPALATLQDATESMRLVAKIYGRE